MALKRIPRKIASVKERVSRIRRKLGTLEGSLYFQRYQSPTWEEATIFDFDDNGITTETLDGGEEVSAHRFTIEVSRIWLDKHANQDGEWQISRDGIERFPVDKESETWQDGQPSATLTFRVSQTISYDL